MKTLLCKVYLFILFIVCCHITNAQDNNIDSLKIDSLERVLLTKKEDTNKINTLNSLSPLYNHNKSKAMQYADIALSLSKKLNFKRGEGLAYYNYGVALLGSDYFGEQGGLNEILKYFNNAIIPYKQAGDQIGIADCYYKISDAYHDIQQNEAEAIHNLLMALKIYEVARMKNRIADCYASFATIYFENGEDSSFISNSQKATEIYKELKDSANIANAYNLLGTMYLNRRDTINSLKLFTAALGIYQKLGNRGPDYGIAYTFGNLGDVHQMQGESQGISGNQEKAEKQFNEALKYYQQRLNLENEGSMSPRSTYIQFGDLYYRLSKIKKGSFRTAALNDSKNYYNKVLDIAKKTNQKLLFIIAYRQLIKIDSSLGNFKASLENYRMYTLYKDSLYNEESSKKIVKVQMQYEFDKKEAKTKAVQDKKDADAKRIKNQQYFAIAALGIVVFAVLVIASIQFRNNRQKQKANVLLQQQKEEIQSTLSELKSTQQQLIQSEKMASLGELTAGIAHEIQNPLNFVNNFSEVSSEMLDEMNEELNKGDIDEAKLISNDIKQNLEKINHHGRRADSIVKGMLQHSRQTKGVKEPTDINALCDEYLRLSYHSLRAKDKNFNADFKTDFDKSIGKIDIVPQDVGRVLLNLFNNAFYATNTKQKNADKNYKPTVSIQTKKLSDKIEISVEDNGNGIPQHIIDKIFQPFFTTKPAGQGTGLGLSLAYDIINKEHNGIIKVESKEGEGSAFVITILT